MTLQAIAAKLAQALRNAPCRAPCSSKDQWPWKASERCAKCRVLDEYDLFMARASIVQTPDTAADAARKG